MKTDIDLIEDHNKSSFDVTMQNINRLQPTLNDIAGLFYANTDEYKRISDDLADATKLHNDMVTHICLARKFHWNLGTTSREMMRFVVELASVLPFHLEILSAKVSMISLDILKKNFEVLYNDKDFWIAKTTPFAVKFNLWKFAYTINHAYYDNLYMINLDLIEKKFAMNDEANNGFQQMKINFIDDINKKESDDLHFFQEILREPDYHCSYC
jgi:hypothetical protein